LKRKHRIIQISSTFLRKFQKKKNLNTNHIAVGDTVLFAEWLGVEAGVYISFTGKVLKIVMWKKSSGKK